MPAALPVLGFLLLVSILQGCIEVSPPGEPAAVTEDLIRLLRDPSPDTRRTAALSLGKIGRPEATGALVEALGDADLIVRQHSAWALGQIGPDALDRAGLPLVQALKDSSPAVREAAARALGEIGTTPAMIMLLTKALRDASRTTREGAVQTLGGLEVASAKQALLAALQDRHPRVRQGAVAALGELGATEAVGPIASRLLEDPDPGVRAEAAFRLGKLGGPQDAELLRKAAVSERNHAVRHWIRWASEQLNQEF
jgi:HEAT repeat protein